MHLVHDNKLLIVCKIDKELWQADLERLCSKLSERFAIYGVFGMRLWESHLTIVSFSFSTSQHLTAVTHAFSLVLLYAISNYSAVVPCHSLPQNTGPSGFFFSRVGW